jgi:hypothetical protein
MYDKENSGCIMNDKKLVILVDWFILPVYVVAFMLFAWVGILILMLATIPSVYAITKSIIFGKDFSWSNIDSYSNEKVNIAFSWWFVKQHEIMSFLLGKSPIDQLRKFEQSKSRSLVKVYSKNKIYCFKGQWFDKHFGFSVTAIANDGEVVAVCSATTIDEAKINIGYIGNQQHYKYRKHFPQGYSIEWVDK